MRWTSDVVTVASPNATWPRVRAALGGASLVIYLGHGNGFPSPYRSVRYPLTEDGMGLNPVGSTDDIAHQYFGESYLAAQIRLAPHAVVVLSHLCYASGNPEPGGPEPTLDVARQRADNFAAGWLAAGADAVIADAIGSPANYARALFSRDQPIEQLWRTAPTNHGHEVVFASERTPGDEVRLDPTAPGHGYFRSLVSAPGLTSRQVLAGSVGTVPDAIPSLRSPAIFAPTFGLPRLEAGSGSFLISGASARVVLPVELPQPAAIPDGSMVAGRWEWLDETAISLSPAPPLHTPPTPPSSEPESLPMASEQPTSGPTGSPPAEPPPVEPIVAPAPSDEIVVSPAALSVDGLTAEVQLPLVPGRYRLTVTMQDRDGAALDGANQIPALIVRVTPRLSVAYGVVREVTIEAGSILRLPVRLANDGAVAWADPPVTPDDFLPSGPIPHPAPLLVGHWIPLSPGVAAPPPLTLAIQRLDAGMEIVVDLDVVAPPVPGDYLLMLDLVTPSEGPLSLSGVPTATIHVLVDRHPELGLRPRAV